MTITYSFVQKPLRLYHASQTSGLTTLVPSADKMRDQEEGSVVFATPSRALASIFLIPWDDSRARSGLFGDRPYVVLKTTRRRFEEEVRGGSIYEVEKDNFQCAPLVGLGVQEWISKKKVKVTKEIFIEYVLEDLLKAGVQVYFVSDEDFQKVCESSDHGYALLQTLPSENQRRNLHIRSFD